MRGRGKIIPFLLLYVAYLSVNCKNSDIGVQDGTGGVSVYLQTGPITIHSADGTNVTSSWFK